MYFQMRKIMNSAVVYPEDAEKDAMSLFKMFFSAMGDKGGPEEGQDGEGEEDKNKDIWENEGSITGKVIQGYA